MRSSRAPNFTTGPTIANSTTWNRGLPFDQSAIVPLGDQALIARLQDEPSAVALACAVRNAGWDWVMDVTPAYSSVGVYFDADRVALGAATAAIAGLKPAPITGSAIRTHRIPCCYERNLDLAAVALYCQLSTDAVIADHVQTVYQIHAIGFTPGFPYLGYLPVSLCGTPRLQSPRLRVEPGSVGLTGRQTGIYPQARPGGWNIIGRTPLVLVDVDDAYFPLRVGDLVEFERIDESEFSKRLGERLDNVR